MKTPHLAWYIQSARFSAPDKRVAMDESTHIKIKIAQRGATLALQEVRRAIKVKEGG